MDKYRIIKLETPHWLSFELYGNMNCKYYEYIIQKRKWFKWVDVKNCNCLEECYKYIEFLNLKQNKTIIKYVNQTT